MTDKLRVLHCSQALTRGGAEEHMVALLRGLDPERFELFLSCPPELSPRLADLPPQVRMAPPIPRHVWNVREGRKWRQYLREWDIQIVHAHLSSASRAVMPWVALTPSAVLVETPHIRESWRRGWKRSAWLDRAAALGVAGFIAVSEANAVYLRHERRLPTGKIHVIRNGIDLDRLHRAMERTPDPRRAFTLSPEEMLLVCAARLEPQKGHAVLLQAMAQLAHLPGPPVRLVCLGEGQLREALLAQSYALGLDRTVCFPGYSGQVPAWLSAADIFVLPSYYEGLPLAAMEASAAGCPVVATAVDGTPEVITDGWNGLLVPPGNVEALTQALHRLLSDALLRQRLGAHGRERARRDFGQKQQITATAALYSDLAAERHRARHDDLASPSGQRTLAAAPTPAGGHHG